MSAIGTTRAIAGSKSRRRANSRTAERVIAYVLGKGVMFALVAVAVFFASSVTGQVAVEQVRKGGLRAKSRALEASRAVIDLNQRINELTDPEKLDKWAADRGMTRDLLVPPAPTEGTLVAQNSH